MVQFARRHGSAYEFNPDCSCAWCSNGGKPPQGYWLNGMYGRVYHAPDGYGNEHSPPRSLRTISTLEVTV